VWILAAGAFLMVTSELLVAGLLPQMARGLEVSVAQTGLLVSVFAFGIAVGAPAMTILTLRLPRRATLTLALLLFAVGQLVIAVSDYFAVVMVARFVTAFVAGGFWAVAAVVATRLSDPAASAKALAVTYSGATLANVVGAPAASFLGQFLGWRGAFTGLAVLVLVVAVLILRLVPADRPEHQHTSVRREFAALRSGRLWLVLLVSAGINGGMLAVYSFISPLLEGRTGLSASVVPLGLAIFGGGAVLGTILAARYSDRFPLRTVLVGTSTTLALMLLLLCLSTVPAPTLVLLGLLGVTGYLANPILVALAVRYAGAAPNLATAISTSAFNLGVTVTTGIAAGALAAVGPIGPVVVGAAAFGLLFIPLLTLVAVQRRTTHPATFTNRKGISSRRDHELNVETVAPTRHPQPAPALTTSSPCYCP
jgi:DHA1 family inner membrane transport protein